jgi:integrase
MSHDVYLKLLEVAPRVHSLLPLALIVAEGTGRRISAWRNLVWDDIDFEAGTIHWRAEHDKKGYDAGDVVPASRRRDEPERGAASDASLGWDSRMSPPLRNGEGPGGEDKLTALLTARGAGEEKAPPHNSR